MSENEMTGNILFFAKTETIPAETVPVIEPVKPEALLVESVCAGDEEAFSELYKKFAPMVHGIALARVARDEAPDIVQNVFLIAYKNLHALRDRNAVGAWLATVARNQANEFYRKTKISEELTEEVGSPGGQQTKAFEILAAIRALPDAYKETLVLRLVEGMTGPEIAEQTGMTHESVRVNLHRGMKLLRRKLGVKE